MRATRRLPALLGAMALAAGLALVPGRAGAVQFVGCSEDALADAIETANTAGGDGLFLSPFCTCTLTQAHSADGASGLPDITAPITLRGSVTDIVRAPGSPEFRIAKVDGTGTKNGELHLVTVTFRGRDAPGIEAGGAIANVAGEVTLASSTLRDNRARVGGGLYNDTGTSTLNGSVVVGNTATDPVGGGGIYELSGSVNLVGTPVRDNAPNSCAPAGSVPFCSG